MYEKVEECPACKHAKYTNVRICKDHTVSQESFALVQCDYCSLVLTNPRPDQNHIGKYYKSENYISHTNKGNNLINVIYKHVRNITLRQKINLIRHYTQGKTILDYGCGTGTFLKYCQKKKYTVSGYEPDPDASKIAGKDLDIEIFNQQEQLKSGSKYDIITAWHVIEHVHELVDTMKLLKTQLSENGYLFIAVPNIASYDAAHYQEHWAAYDVPRHLYHFSQKSFRQLASQCKLTIKDIHPMKFDSYYVSLLSEKYKTNRSSFAKALATGFKSNSKAKKTGEYSSLIYVLTK